MEEGTIYAAFGGQVFALHHDDSNFRIHVLNNTRSSWDLYLEQELIMLTMNFHVKDHILTKKIVRQEAEHSDSVKS